jgi:hypothetical protein
MWLQVSKSLKCLILMKTTFNPKKLKNKKFFGCLKLLQPKKNLFLGHNC